MPEMLNNKTDAVIQLNGEETFLIPSPSVFSSPIITHTFWSFTDHSSAVDPPKKNPCLKSSVFY